MVSVPALLINMLVAVCPKIPYESRFNAEVHPGFQITIMGHTNQGYHEGLVSPTRKGFIINLNGENSVRGFRVFHVNPRFDKDSTMVLNTRYKSAWGPEQRHRNHQMAGNQDFRLIIQAHKHVFKIFVNGRHYADYKYKQPLQRITGISIKGLVTIHQFIAKQYDLNILPVPEIYTPTDVVVQAGFPIVRQNPAIPISIPLPGQIRVGMVVAIVGKPLQGNRFYVDWTTYYSDVAFHLTPRFDISKLVMNSYSDGNWGPDVSFRPSPFQLNDTFYLFVKTHSTHYEVWINGEHFYNFKHRQISPEDVTNIEIFEKNGIYIDNITITY